MVSVPLRLLYLVAAVSSLLSWSLGQATQTSRPIASSASSKKPDLPAGRPAIGLQVGQPIPLSRFQTPQGQSFSLHDLRGRWLLLNFWATWCEPCREEMPSLERLARLYADQGLPFLLLAASVDQSWKDVQQFLAQDPSLRDLRLKMRLVWDKGGQEALRFGTSKFPETYLIDPQGRLRQKFVGFFRWDSQEIQAQIQQRMRSNHP